VLFSGFSNFESWFPAVHQVLLMESPQSTTIDEKEWCCSRKVVDSTVGIVFLLTEQKLPFSTEEKLR
jgi:hypothetical protein